MDTPLALPPRGSRVGSMAFTVMPLAAAVRWVCDASAAVAAGALGHPGLAVHFCNAHNVALARPDAAYARLPPAAAVGFSAAVPPPGVGRRAAQARGNRQVLGQPQRDLFGPPGRFGQRLGRPQHQVVRRRRQLRRERPVQGQARRGALLHHVAEIGSAHV